MGGTPLPPFTDFSPKIFLQKGLKIVFFAQKTPDFGPKNRLRIWGVPPSPPLRIFFQQKGGYGFGGYPPPFTDKMRKVVFEVFPKELANFMKAILSALLTTSGKQTTKASCGRTSERSMRPVKRRREHDDT